MINAKFQIHHMSDPEEGFDLVIKQVKGNQDPAVGLIMW